MCLFLCVCVTSPRPFSLSLPLFLSLSLSLALARSRSQDAIEIMFIIEDKARAKKYGSFIYYETIKREQNKRLIHECRCDERRKAKAETSTRLAYNRELRACIPCMCVCVCVCV